MVSSLPQHRLTDHDTSKNKLLTLRFIYEVKHFCLCHGSWLIIAFIGGVVTNQFLMFDPSKFTHTYRRLDSNADATNSPVKVVSLIGERSSGTEWMYDELIRCFNGTKVEVKRGLVRDKHWFQFDDGEEHNKTVVVALFRNPYDWSKAMQKNPHHAPNHIELDWYRFMTNPWVTDRVGADLELPSNTSDIVCQEKFRYHEVLSCSNYSWPKGRIKWNTRRFQRHPVYELRTDGSGLPYGSILELRRDKILNFLSVANYDWVHKVLPVRYEYTLSRGTGYLIKKIEEVTGVTAQCQPSRPKKSKGEGKIDEAHAKWLSRYADWDTENLIGYKSSH